MLEPMVRAARGYVFDQVAFDAAYGRLEELLATEARVVEVAVPLKALTTTSGVEEIGLPGNLVLRSMSDRQMSAAISYLAVPAVFAGGPNSVTMSRFHQWALTRCTHKSTSTAV